MIGKNHIIPLALCILALFSILLPIFSVSARESSVGNTNEIPMDSAAIYEEEPNEQNTYRNEASKEETSDFCLFTLDTGNPTTFTTAEKTVTLYPAVLNADANEDGKCNAVDARVILRVSSRLDTLSTDKTVLDVNCDGEITAADARFVLRYSACIDRYFLGKDGEKITGFAKNSENKTFYFKNGIIASGLTEIDGNLYFFDESEGMKTGLISIGGKLYGFSENGTALHGKHIISSAVYFFEKGVAQKGLIKDGDYYYFIEDNYKAATGKRKINGTNYDFGTDGKGSPYTVKENLKIAMLGDSLVANIGMQNVTDKIDFYGKVSLHASTIFSKKISGSSRFIIDEINGRGYDAVIILIGINDLSNSDKAWAEQYRAIIKGVKERSPDSTVYAHAILPINEQKAKRSGYSCTNAQIIGKNKVIKNVAEQEGAIYIDPASVLADKNGSLPADAASDGIHISNSYCKKWGAWLLETVYQ